METLSEIMRRQLEPEPTADPDVDIFKFPLRTGEVLVEDGVEYPMMRLVRFPWYRYRRVLN